jgi:uncharacterized ferritin-like protein (DUF455 family)
MTSPACKGVPSALPVDLWARRLAGVRQVLLSASDHACLWLIEESELPDKYRLAKLTWDLNWCADALAGRLLQLRTEEEALSCPAAHPQDAALLALLAGGPRSSRLQLLEDTVVPALSRLAGELRQSCDPLFDEGTEHCLAQIENRLGRSAAESHGSGSGAERGSTALEFTVLPPVAVPEDLEPGRPAGHPPTPGYEWPNWKESLPEFLHAVALGIEVCAAEVCAMAIVSHPDMPAGLRFDLARQVSDEMRHAYMLFNRAAELGVEPMSIPYDTEVWDQLRPAETLLDRLTLEQRIGEGHGLDDAANMRDRFLERGDERTAAVFDFITADEVMHVRSGNHWIRSLLAGSQDRVDAQDASARAKSEALGLSVREVPPYLNLPLRRLAGFTEHELRRLTDSLDQRS